MPPRFIRNSILLILLVLTIILVPFFFFHEYLDSWTAKLLKTSAENAGYIALLLCLLLLSDILLPVPSSIVSTGAGFILGFFNGALIIFIGMTLGCFLGYMLGRRSGSAMPWLDAETRAAIEKFFLRSGKWSIIIARPIPVLAEASVFFAGISRMHFGSFMWISSLANLGISLVYAAVGAFAVSVNSLMPAFLGAMILPAIAWACEKIFSKRAQKIKRSITISGKKKARII